MFVLERNASSVCKRLLEDFNTLDCISYARLGDAAGYEFKGAEYKLGEGLALDDDYIYIVFDNNRQKRLATGSKNTLLLRIERPRGW